MKYVVTASGEDLDASLDPRFGRCAFFLVGDTASDAVRAVPNPFVEAAGGAGTQAAQWVVDQDVEVLLTGHCGPKAAAVLADAEIRVVEGASGRVRDALTQLTAAPTPEAGADRT